MSRMLFRSPSTAPRSARLSFVLSLMAFSACATVPDPAPVGGDVPSAGEVELVDASATRSTPAGSAQSAEVQDPEVQELVRTIWREPSFQRQLQQSWLRGSEIEPAMTAREAEVRLEVLQLIEEGQLDDASARLRQRQGGEGVTAVFDYMLGNLYLNQEKWQEAVAEYTKAVAKEPGYRNAWRNRGLALMRLEDYAGAASSLVEVIKLGGNSPATWGMLATMHARNQDYVAAEQAFRMVAMLEPQQDRWRQSLAMALIGQGRNAEAASLLGSLAEKDPDNAALWLRQARAYANMGETKKAAENLEIVDQLGGSTFRSLSMLGAIYFNEGLYELAVDAYLRSMEREDRGEHAGVLRVANRLAAVSAYDESKRLVEGIEQAYAATLDDSAKTELLKLRARLAASSGATEEQVALLQQIVRENPLDGDALMQLGRYYQEAGDQETAVFRYEQAARIKDFAADAKFLHARLLVEKQDFRSALPLLREAQQIERREHVQSLLDYVERAAGRQKG